MVGIVVPLFESETTIATTLRSVQGQTLHDWRCVVVNDGSTDAGPPIARQFATADPRIRVVDQANRGLSGARNRGIGLVRGDYVMFLDADDVLFGTALESLVRGARESGLPGAYCGYEFLGEWGNPIGRQSAATCDPVGIDELLEWNRFIAHSQVIRRDALADDRFDESLTSGEDYDLWLRLGERGIRWAAVDRFGVGYRIRADGMSKDFQRMAENETDILRRSFRRVRAKENAGRLIGVDASSERERRVLTHSALAYVTRAAIAPGVRLEEARSLFADLREDHALTAGQVATASIFAIQYGSACAPEVATREPEAWAPDLDRWWRELATSGWTVEPDSDTFAWSVLREFASRSVSPHAVAREAVRRALDANRMIAAPFDARTRWIGRVASELGVATVFVCADADQARTDPRHDIGALSACVASMDEIGGTDEPRLVVAPDQMDAVVWEEVHAELARSAWEELRHCWAAHAGMGQRRCTLCAPHADTPDRTKGASWSTTRDARW